VLQKNKYIKNFIKKDLSWKIKKEYLFEIQEPFLIISSPDLINQKNSFSRKEIDQELYKIITTDGVDYAKEFNLNISGDSGYYLKKLNKPNTFSEQNDKIVFLFVVDGKGTLNINNKKYKLREEDYFLFPSHFTYNYTIQPDSNLMFVYSFIG